MSIRMIIGAAIAGAIFGIMAPQLGAQSMSTLRNAKRVASNAAAATNEHTRQEQMVGDAPSAAAKPASEPAAKASRKPRAAEKKTAAPKRDVAAKPAAPAKVPGKTTAIAANSTGPDGKPMGPDGQAEKAPSNEITLQRESFSYNVDGRRDPFVSLIASGELRPMISDLRLVTVIFDPAGRSVAIMRDVSTQEQYRVKAGQTLGRMRVARIAPKSVMFTIEEYGFSRQEMLTLNDTTRARSQ